MTSTARITRTTKTDRFDLDLYDWHIDVAASATTTLYARAMEYGLHARVAVDYNRDFPSLVRASVVVAAHHDPVIGPVYAVGTSGQNDDPDAVYDNAAEAWEAAVTLARSLGAWNAAWDARIPATEHHCPPLDPRDPAVAAAVPIIRVAEVMSTEYADAA